MVGSINNIKEKGCCAAFYDKSKGFDMGRCNGREGFLRAVISLIHKRLPPLPEGRNRTGLWLFD